MKPIKKYSLPINETYFGILKVKYKNEEKGIIKVKGFFAYKRGEYKDYIVEGPKTYTFPIKSMEHWQEIE